MHDLFVQPPECCLMLYRLSKTFPAIENLHSEAKILQAFPFEQNLCGHRGLPAWSNLHDLSLNVSKDAMSDRNQECGMKEEEEKVRLQKKGLAIRTIKRGT